MSGSTDVIRSCDGCTLCCKLLRIETLDKPAGAWCPHCNVGSGCMIYGNRPVDCRNFLCSYLTEPTLDARWKPSECRLVLQTLSGTRRLDIHVDPTRPDAWRREPFYSEIKRWTKDALATGAQVVVLVGTRAWMALPDRDADLGALTPGDHIVTRMSPTSDGMRYEAYLVGKDDPRAANTPSTFTAGLSSPMPFVIRR